VSSPNGPVCCGASEAVRLAVIGCGNLARRDDGAGVEVVRALMSASSRPAGVEYIDAGTAGMDVLYRVRGTARVVIIDACRSGSTPGAVFRLPGREAMTPVEHGFTLHGLRWDHALYAGCRMFGPDFADRTEVILIEGGCFDFGLELSEPVQRAAACVAQMLTAEMAAGGG